MNAQIDPSAIKRNLTRKATLAPLVCALIFLGFRAPATSATQISLLLPQSIAFSVLGHSCGGIQEKAYATGFDPVSGYPTGDVYIQTRCGGSGRGGGYHTTTYSAWVNATWDFAGNVVSFSRLTTAPLVSSTFTATDANGDLVYNAGAAAFLSVPIPDPPTIVTAAETGDEFQVSWTPAPVIPAVITSSTLVATPVNSPASILVATITGSGQTGLIGPLQPQTTYEISVVSTTIGGSSAPSDPVTVTTVAASVAPSAPTGLSARWGTEGATTATLLASWKAAAPGDSPVDQYQIAIKGSDGGGTFTQTLAGTTLAASFIVDFIPDWSVMVRAHNAVGWGAWSSRFTLGGL